MTNEEVEILNKIKEKNKIFYDSLMLYAQSKTLRALNLLLLDSKQYIRIDSIDYFRPTFEVNKGGEIVLAELVLRGMPYFLRLDPQTLTIHLID